MERGRSEIIFLKGRRVHLRPPQKEDIQLFLKWFNDQEVSQYLKLFFPMMETGETEWFNELHKHMNEHILLVIVETKSGKPIGTMGLHAINWKDRRATSGAIIGEKKFWGKGYGSEAKMLFLDYAFNTLNLRKICSGVMDFNKRSQAYNRKCGYKVEGVRKEQVFRNGRYCDEVLMAVFRKDWLQLWKKFERTGKV